MQTYKETLLKCWHHFSGGLKRREDMHWKPASFHFHDGLLLTQGGLASTYWVLHQGGMMRGGIALETGRSHLSFGFCVTRGCCSFLYISNYSAIYGWVLTGWNHLQRCRHSEDRGRALRSWLFCWWEQTYTQEPIHGQDQATHPLLLDSVGQCQFPEEDRVKSPSLWQNYSRFPGRWF